MKMITENKEYLKLNGEAIQQMGNTKKILSEFINGYKERDIKDYTMRYNYDHKYQSILNDLNNLVQCTGKC